MTTETARGIFDGPTSPMQRDGNDEMNLTLAIDTLQAAQRGEYDDEDYCRAIRRTAERLLILADKLTTTIRCPRCHAQAKTTPCVNCDYHFGDGFNG